MKKFGISAFVAAFASTAVLAQAADEASLSSSAAAGLNFSGSVKAGMRSDIEGAVSNGQTKSLIGPYVNPNISLGSEGPRYNLTLGYSFEAFGGQGFGGGFEDDASKDFAKNAEFTHIPSVFFSGKISDRVSIVNYAEYWHVTNSDDQTINRTEAYVQPDLKVMINDRLTLGVGYHYYRIENPDAVGLGADSSTLAFASTDGATASGSTMQQAITDLNNSLQTTVYQRHAGRALAEVKLTDRTTYKTYVHAGRIYLNKDRADKYTYRWNSDLSTKVTPDLDLGIRYRFNIDDVENSPNLGWYHLVRADFNYGLTANTAIVFENELVYVQNNQGDAETYSSSNYLGFAYNF